MMSPWCPPSRRISCTQPQAGGIYLQNRGAFGNLHQTGVSVVIRTAAIISHRDAILHNFGKPRLWLGQLRRMEPRYIDVKNYKEWNFDLKVNFKGLFKAIAKGFAAKVLVDPKTAIAAGSDAFDAINITLDHGVSFRAYHLIFRAMQRALNYLVHSPEHTPAIADAMPPERFKIYEAVSFQTMVDDMQALFDAAEAKEFKIQASFFRNPEQLGIVDDVRELFEAWLQKLELSPIQAGHIGGRLGTVFVRMLNEVWDENPTDYIKIREEFQDVFPETHLHERNKYNLKLKEEWERPIFDETFGLAKIYIPLRAAYPQKRKKEDSERKKVLQVVDAESHIKAWISNVHSEYKILVLRGGPGSGKSSLMKKLVFDLAQENRQPVFFIELQHFQLDSSVETAIESYFERTFSEKIFSKAAKGNTKHPILVFDGLDELSRADKSGLEVAKMLVEDLVKLTDRLQRDEWNPRIIITGRDLLLQPFERSFEKEGQVLELLPYRRKYDTQDVEYRGYEKLLEASQLETWWEKYLALKPGAPSVPQFLNQKNFIDLVDQPLLNFLLALTYLRGEADFGENANINNVYYDLMARVLDRPWGKHTHLKWSIEEFMEVMEEVATSAWHTHGDVRITTMSKVRAHCERNPEVHARILALESNPDAGYMRLMAAFYFRQDGHEVHDKTFEFTHKTFGEYLVARRIVTLVKHIIHGLANPKYYSMEQAKQDWLAVCGVEELTEYIWPFLERQVALEYKDKKEESAKIQKTLADLFSEFINQGFEPNKELKTNLDIFRASRNAESTLLLTISAFARVSGIRTKIKWRDSKNPKTVLSRLFLGSFGVIGEALFAIDFPEKSQMFWMGLVEVDIRTANLVGANLFRANLEKSLLSEINLSYANLGFANLNWANLNRANLRGAYLEGANLEGADLQGANLQGADLRKANLQGADLRKANLQGADLRKANLSNAHIEAANLCKADLRLTNLNFVYLKGANLQGSQLYPFFIDNDLLEGVNAYDNIINKGALNVPKPEGMK